MKLTYLGAKYSTGGEIFYNGLKGRSLVGVGAWHESQACGFGMQVCWGTQSTLHDQHAFMGRIWPLHH
jgi:hypothetical protein